VTVETTEVPTPVVEEPTTPSFAVEDCADQPKAEATPEPATTSGPVATVERVRESTIEKPTKAVWSIADEVKATDPKVTRKAIVDECVRRGAAFYTARTQYQRWAKSKATPVA
jgi:hypothetical protein